MMPNCYHKNCRKVGELGVHISLPSSKDSWWKQGQEIYLCKKHYDKLLKDLQIKESE